MTDQFFQSQMERLRTNRNWASAFQDLGRLQAIKNRLKFYDAAAFEEAVTYMIGELRMPPTDSEIFDTLSRFTKRRVTNLSGGSGYACTTCSDGFVFVFSREEPHYQSVMRCSCALGARITAPIDPKGRQWLTWSPNATSPNGPYMFDRPYTQRSE